DRVRPPREADPKTRGGLDAPAASLRRLGNNGRRFQRHSACAHGKPSAQTRRRSEPAPLDKDRALGGLSLHARVLAGLPGAAFLVISSAFPPMSASRLSACPGFESSGLRVRCSSAAPALAKRPSLLWRRPPRFISTGGSSRDSPRTRTLQATTSTSARTSTG